jgi:hypothetical protein
MQIVPSSRKIWRRYSKEVMLRTAKIPLNSYFSNHPKVLLIEAKKSEKIVTQQ